MKIDLSKLFKGLEALPHMPVPEPENVPPYVLTHILEPLKTNHAVSFMELDFESFTRMQNGIKLAPSFRQCES